ncbi:MAG: hypothetical protein HY833_02025 [Candidatus Aenigmarchaeota archaeon]|nr:hypothetical protein [Candidatus Aenigmarchaeota archaeon]
MSIRELSVPMEDEFSKQPYGFKVQVLPFPAVKSNYVAVFSLGRDDIYEYFGARKSDIESFKYVNGLTDVKRPVLSEPRFMGGNAYADVMSFSRPKSHKVVGPYVRSRGDTGSLLSGHYSCTCEAGDNTRHEVNLKGCAHMVSLIDSMSLSRGTHHMGFASDDMNRAVTWVIRKYARDKKKIDSASFYRLFPNYPDKLKKIVRDNFLPTKTT